MVRRIAHLQIRPVEAGGKQQSKENLHFLTVLHRSLCNSDRQQRGVCCVSSRSLWTTSSWYETWGGHLYALTHHLFNPCLVTPECLLSETCLLVWPCACSHRNGSPLLPVVPWSYSYPSVSWCRNAKEHWDGLFCPSDLQKVEREMLPSTEWEPGVMDGSKQSNSVAFLYKKRKNICQGWMMCVASGSIIQFSFFRMHCRHRERESHVDK